MQLENLPDKREMIVLEEDEGDENNQLWKSL